MKIVSLNKVAPAGYEPVNPDEPDWRLLYKDETDIEIATKHWHKVVTEMQEMNTLTVVNGYMIRRLVEFNVQYERASRTISDDGPIVRSNRGGTATKHSLYWAVMKHSSDAITALEAELGITPLRRAKAQQVNRTRRKQRAADNYLASSN